jgi:CBS-domain-containing membrane protein
MWHSMESYREALHKSEGELAGEICHDATTVTVDCKLEEVADIIVRRRVHRLAVVGKDGKFLGVVSRGDILAATLRAMNAASPK